VLNAPTPFLNDDVDTQTFIEGFYTRTRHSRETNISYYHTDLMDEASAEQYNATWTTNFKQSGRLDVNNT
jgi:hypothetical protein